MASTCVVPNSFRPHVRLTGTTGPDHSGCIHRLPPASRPGDPPPRFRRQRTPEGDPGGIPGHPAPRSRRRDEHPTVAEGWIGPGYPDTPSAARGAQGKRCRTLVAYPRMELALRPQCRASGHLPHGHSASSTHLVAGVERPRYFPPTGAAADQVDSVPEFRHRAPPGSAHTEARCGVWITTSPRRTPARDVPGLRGAASHCPGQRPAEGRDGPGRPPHPPESCVSSWDTPVHEQRDVRARISYEVPSALRHRELPATVTWWQSPETPSPATSTILDSQGTHHGDHPHGPPGSVRCRHGRRSGDVTCVCGGTGMVPQLLSEASPVSTPPSGECEPLARGGTRGGEQARNRALPAAGAVRDLAIRL